jgi:predicted nucleic acid-binding protein
MILYLDTSALVKLFIQEVGTHAVQAAATTAASLATSSVAYAEAWAALARRQREGTLAPADLRRVLAELDNQWQSYSVVEAAMGIARAAGPLAERHALRAFDAIHLASALTLHAQAPGLVTFCCADVRLNAAATAEGIAIATI